MTRRFKSIPSEVMRAVDTLQQMGMEWKLPERELFRLTVALEECASNIVNHALGHDPTRFFQLSLEYTQSILTIELRDNGSEFNPNLHQPDLSTHDRQPGGWGISLVRKYTDEVHYQRVNGENVLQLKKGFPSIS